MRRSAARPVVVSRPIAPARAAAQGLDSLLAEDAPKHERASLLAEQQRLLKAVIDADEGEQLDADRDTNLYPSERDAFPDMLERVREGRTLTPKQLGWVQAAAERLGVDAAPPEPVPRGREIELAPVLQHRPLAPPGRRAALPAPPPGPETEKPCRCGAKGKGYQGFHYSGAPGCAHEERPSPGWLEVLAMLLALPVEKVADAYQKAVEIDRERERTGVLRTPEGTIHNCALAGGGAENTCQVCQGQCPDLERMRAQNAQKRRDLDLIRSRLGKIGLGPDRPPPEDRPGCDDDVPF